MAVCFSLIFSLTQNCCCEVENYTGMGMTESHIFCKNYTAGVETDVAEGGKEMWKWRCILL